ncbi:Hypothetical Protein OBI_RACECAR_133 [Arthrobacter phage Racecar]|nr:hypothetical protein PBI_RACECAR_215 [Arthrobacter phage Racecar]
MSGFTSRVISETVLWKDYETQTFETGRCHIVKEQTSMSVSDKTVSIYEKKLLKGTSKNGVVWHKWKTMRSNHFSVKTGHLEHYSRSGRFFHNVTKSLGFPYPDKQEVHDAINLLLKNNGLKTIEKFEGRAIFNNSYPLFENFGWNATYSRGIPYMRSSDIQEFTRKLFGKTRYRKDLVRAVAQTTNPEVLKNAYWMRGFVPIDWIIKYLNANRDSARSFVKLPIRPGFRNMTMNQRKAVVDYLSNPMIGDLYFVEDLLKFASDLPKETVQSVKMKPSTLYEAHVHLSRELTKIRTDNTTIEPTKLAKDILKIDWSDTGFTMEPAKTLHQVIDWGTEMNHCIGSYARSAAYGTYTLTGLYRDGKLFGNAMFEKRSCVQIFGKNNQPLSDEVLNHVMDKLDRISFRTTWGVPESLKDERKSKLEKLEQEVLAQPWLDPVPF